MTTRLNDCRSAPDEEARYPDSPEARRRGGGEAPATYEQFAAAVGAYVPSREERMRIASRQARFGIDALGAGDVAGARALLVDALYHLDQIERTP